MILRPYQTTGLDEIEAAFAAGVRRALYVLPTGGGKTVMFAELARREPGRVLILAHRRNLIRQASAKLTGIGVKHGVIAPGFAPVPERRVQVGSIQTASRRLGSLPHFDLIIVDEAHHAVSAQWAALFEVQPGARICGVTATPQRLDGLGLGGVFKLLILGPSIADLTRDGYLSPVLVYAPVAGPDLSGVRVVAGEFHTGDVAGVMDRRSVTGNAAAHYERIASFEPFIGFCTSVAHAEHAAAEFCAEGWRVVALSGDTDERVIEQAFRDLASGAIQGVMSCALIDEGLDVPAVSVVIDLAPSKSLTRVMQRVGRGMRPAAGKSRLVVLDHAGNTFRHGMPDTPRSWTLEGRKRGDDVPPVRQCPACYAMHAPAPECPECGYDYAAARAESDRRELARVAGELSAMTPEDIRLQHLRTAPLKELQRGARTMADLEEIAKARGFDHRWPKRVAVFLPKPPRESQDGAEFMQ